MFSVAPCPQNRCMIRETIVKGEPVPPGARRNESGGFVHQRGDGYSV